METYRRCAAVIVALAITGCATVKPVPQTPVLAPQGDVGNVKFLGTMPAPDTLYVCQFANPTELVCIDYVYFMEQLRKDALHRASAAPDKSATR
jgi:hypothetical protein